MVEIMRADLDEDGIEDILVYWQDRALHGTYGDGGTFILSRRSAHAQFERLSSWPRQKTPLQLWYGEPSPETLARAASLDFRITPTPLETDHE
jgi:hypothetical protein